jgi:RNA-directed DNA polymerase
LLIPLLRSIPTFHSYFRRIAYPRVKGGSNEYKNLELVHISCHLEYHKVFPAKGETPNDIQLRSGKKYIKAKKISGLI